MGEGAFEIRKKHCHHSHTILNLFRRLAWNILTLQRLGSEGRQASFNYNRASEPAPLFAYSGNHQGVGLAVGLRSILRMAGKVDPAIDRHREPRQLPSSSTSTVRDDVGKLLYDENLCPACK